MQTVVIRKGDKIIRINFTFNSDLVDIMRKYKGWFFRKEKAWQFPRSKFSTIYDELTSKGYNVHVRKMEEPRYKSARKQTQTKIDIWSNPNAVSVFGRCKKCGRKRFVNKDSICVECSFKND